MQEVEEEFLEKIPLFEEVLFQPSGIEVMEKAGISFSSEHYTIMEFIIEYAMCKKDDLESTNIPEYINSEPLLKMAVHDICYKMLVYDVWK